MVYTQSMTKLGVGIIGTGQISPLHAAGYLADDRVRLQAVCDTRQDLAVERALEWNASRYYTDYRELLEDEQVQIPWFLVLLAEVETVLKQLLACN